MRPKSVKELCKQFETSSGKPLTPADFERQSRKEMSSAQAVRHNMLVRVEQMRSRKADLLEDDRLSGLSESEIFDSILECSEEQRQDALAAFLDTDGMVGDEHIDKLNIKQLIDLLKEHGMQVPLSTIRIGELRRKAMHVTNGTEHVSGNKTEFSELADALSHGTERDINRAILTMFFEEFDPEQIERVEMLLEEHKGQEDELLADIARQYPEAAEKLVYFSITAAYDEPSTSAERPTRRRASFVLSAVQNNS